MIFDFGIVWCFPPSWSMCNSGRLALVGDAAKHGLELMWVIRMLFVVYDESTNIYSYFPSCQWFLPIVLVPWINFIQMSLCLDDDHFLAGVKWKQNRKASSWSGTPLPAVKFRITDVYDHREVIAMMGMNEVCGRLNTAADIMSQQKSLRKAHIDVVVLRSWIYITGMDCPDTQSFHL